MSQPPKKRKFWQLHLSTVVLLMFVANGLLWINFRTYSCCIDSGVQANRACGWPFEWLIWMNFADGSDSKPNLYLGAIFDPAAAILILAIIAISIEHLIRRREGRKS